MHLRLMHLQLNSIRTIFAVLMVTAAMAGCSGGSAHVPSTPSEGSASSSPFSGSGQGTLTIRITDSPFSDAEALLVTFSEVSVHRSESGWETIAFAGGASGRTCDLKKLQGPTDVLGVGVLPAGHYTQIRLTIASATIYSDNASGGSPCATVIPPPAGAGAPVDVPSGVVKLNREFTLASGGETTIVLDFDGDKSIKLTGSGNGNGNGAGNGRGNGNGGQQIGKYIMTPVIGVVSVQ